MQWSGLTAIVMAAVEGSLNLAQQWERQAADAGTSFIAAASATGIGIGDHVVCRECLALFPWACLC